MIGDIHCTLFTADREIIFFTLSRNKMSLRYLLLANQFPVCRINLRGACETSHRTALRVAYRAFVFTHSGGSDWIQYIFSRKIYAWRERGGRGGEREIQVA